MSLDDFDRLGPGEFSAVVRHARRVRRDRELSELAMVRLHAAICVQPHVSKSIRPADLFTIPEIDNPPKREDESREQPRQLTREEQRERYELLLKEREDGR